MQFIIMRIIIIIIAIITIIILNYNHCFERPALVGCQLLAGLPGLSRRPRDLIIVINLWRF